MKILHITPVSNGYEEAILIANRISKKNGLAYIGKYEGDTEIEYKEYMTGGFLLNDTPQIRKMLDLIPKKEQYDFVKSFKMDPFIKTYLEE